MASIYGKAERYKLFLKFFFEKYEPRCCFCNEKLDWKTFFRKLGGSDLDDLTEHHINGQHFDNRVANRTLAHRKCHLKYHRQKEIQDRKEAFEKLLTTSEVLVEV